MPCEPFLLQFPVFAIAAGANLVGIKNGTLVSQFELAAWTFNNGAIQAIPLFSDLPAAEEMIEKQELRYPMLPIGFATPEILWTQLSIFIPPNTKIVLDPTHRGAIGDRFYDYGEFVNQLRSEFR